MAIFIGGIDVSPASAAASTYDAYAPVRQGDSITGWANLNRDCAGTFGCWNYIKIERSRLWGMEFVGGQWATNHGWNSITVQLPAGCHDYRTTVWSYNDALITTSLGANAGPVGASLSGQTIYRFQKPWSSGFIRICR